MARPARRFLAPGARAGDGHGYLNKPQRPLENTLEPDPPEVVDLIASATRLVDEPECNSEDLADYARTAKFHRTQQHIKSVMAARDLRPLLDTEDRIRDAERRAKQSHRDLSHEFHTLRLMLQRADRGGRKTPESAVRKLERIEATLDGISLDEAA